jgi:hypothetical protein
VIEHVSGVDKGGFMLDAQIVDERKLPLLRG